MVTDARRVRVRTPHGQTESATWRDVRVEMCKSVLPNLTTVYLGDGIHYLQEDHPHEIGDGIANWYGGL